MTTAHAPAPPAQVGPDVECCRRCPYPLIHERHPEPREGWRQHAGRGLCPPCWKDAKANGDLPDYERRLRPRDEVLDEWDFLRRAGVTRAEAAARMGVRLDSLDKQIWRASKDGDPRAVYGTRGHVPTTKEKETHEVSTSSDTPEVDLTDTAPPSWFGGPAPVEEPDLWDDTCDRSDCGEPAEDSPVTKYVDDGYGNAVDQDYYLCRTHINDPTQLSPEARANYWEAISTGADPDEAVAGAHAYQEEQRTVREIQREHQQDTGDTHGRELCDA